MKKFDLEVASKFISEMKTTRLSLRLTQVQVGQSLNKKTGNQSISQYIICRFELAMMEDSTLTDLFPKEQVKVYKKL